MVKANHILENPVKVGVLIEFSISDSSPKDHTRQPWVIPQDVLHLLKKKETIFDSKSFQAPPEVLLL